MEDADVNAVRLRPRVVGDTHEAGAYKPPEDAQRPADGPFEDAADFATRPADSQFEEVDAGGETRVDTGVAAIRPERTTERQPVAVYFGNAFG